MNLQAKNDFLPLRVGISIPTAHPTAGGAYELEHAVFNEALIRYFRSIHPLISLVPIAFNHIQFADWDLDPNRCLHIEASSEQKTKNHLRQQLHSVRAIVRSAHRLLRGIPAKPMGLPVASLATYIDVLWSVTPFTITTSIPFIITVWDLQHRLQPFFPEVSASGDWPWGERQNHYCEVAKKAFYCVVGTKRGAHELERFFGIDPDRILVNAFPCPDPLGIAGDEAEKVLDKLHLEAQSYILYPAQFWSHKNHLCLFYAIQILRFKGIEIKVVLPGSDKGILVSLVEKAIRLGVRDLVVIPGFVSRLELAGLYRNSLALAYPSFFGPDNIPPLEAMSYGIPAIVASVPGSQEQYGDAALFFDPLKPEELASCIERLLLDPTLRLEIVRRGTHLVSALTPANYVLNIENLIAKHYVALQCCSLGRSRQ